MPIYSPGPTSIDMLLQKLASYNRKVTALPNAASNVNGVLTYNSVSYQSNGTRWFSTQEYVIPIAPITLTASGQVSIPTPVSTWLITQLDLNVTQANAGTTTNFWSWTLAQFGGITSGTVDTKTQSAGVGAIYSYTSFGTTAQNPASLPNGRATLTFTQNNVAAGNITVFGAATYRKVG